VSQPDLTPLLERSLVEGLTRVTADAATVIMREREAGASVREKADLSPVTAADEAAEDVILQRLSALLPGLPVIAEEQVASGLPVVPGQVFALVDPLDGTREFIAGRGEFTVNLALIAGGVPVIGIVAAPALGFTWRGVLGRGAMRMRLDGSDAQPIRCRTWPDQSALGLISRSHPDPISTALIERLDLSTEAIGSALKFCRLAEGAADLYPRFGTTCEWDIAAGHALVSAAGGIVVAPDGGALTFGNDVAGFRVPGFLALADPTRLEEVLRAAPRDGGRP
jgi:3'(2'), 5'-bisphosphate nucleotidase